jgi:deoxycytidine triphosphate deaminase
VSAPFDPSDFAETREQAEERFARCKSEDPLPDIAPALLNTADLLAYVALTGMIWPFRSDPANPQQTLKPASCAVAPGGLYVYWTDPKEEGEEPRIVTGALADREPLTLERNSIVYLTVAPEFRLPDYIAARFNLKIRDIYRGLLVGTGPLVDPGFVGRLSIPIHNLTSNQYQIVGGEPLVWMEFTKLSRNERWDPGYTRPAGAPATEYVPFPTEKIGRRDIHDYVRHANSGHAIRSSIPDLVGRTQQSALRAEQGAKASADAAASLRRRFTQFGFVGLIAAIAAIAALVFGSITVVQNAQNTDDTVRSSFRTLENTVTTQAQIVRAQGKEIALLKAHQRRRR